MVNFEEEVWKDIPDFEGMYQVSNKGRVKSLPRQVKRGNIEGVLKEKLLSPCLAGDRTKYQSVTLYKDGKRYRKKVHHAVLETFEGPKPFPKAIGRHLDDDSLNNDRQNLAWGTSSDNALDKFRNGYQHHAISLTLAQVDAIYRDPRSQRAIADDYGISQKVVWAVKNEIYCLQR